MDFGLARFDTIHRTRRLELREISADAAAPLTLILAQIHAGNGRYNAWLLMHAAPDEASLPKEGTPERREYEGERNVLMFAAAAVVGWENVAGNGEPAECTAENAAEFLRQLRTHRRDVFQKVAGFVIDPANWTTDAIPPTDPVVLGKD